MFVVASLCSRLTCWWRPTASGRRLCSRSWGWIPVLVLRCSLADRGSCRSLQRETFSWAPSTLHIQVKSNNQIINKVRVIHMSMEALRNKCEKMVVIHFPTFTFFLWKQVKRFCDMNLVHRRQRSTMPHIVNWTRSMIFFLQVSLKCQCRQGTQGPYSHSGHFPLTSCSEWKS